MPVVREKLKVMGIAFSRWFRPLSRPPPDRIKHVDIPPGPICNVAKCSEPSCCLSVDETKSQMTALREHIKLSERNYNFAIAGTAGSGKSSLVNSVRGMTENDAFECEYAPEGSDTETTLAVTQYEHPMLPYIRLFDLPGGNTDDHPAHGYFFQKACFAYDYIIVVITNRIQSIDLDIIEQAVKWQVPWVLVRTRCDLILREKIRKDAKVDLEAVKNDLRQSTKRDLIRQLKENRKLTNVEPVVFLVSAPVYQGWTEILEHNFHLDEHNLLIWLVKSSQSRRRATGDDWEHICENCQEELSEIILHPCGHLICSRCREVMNVFWSRECAVCRKKVGYTVLVNLAFDRYKVTDLLDTSRSLVVDTI